MIRHGSYSVRSDVCEQAMFKIAVEHKDQAQQAVTIATIAEVITYKSP
jgi:hypothetical protein